MNSTGQRLQHLNSHCIRLANDRFGLEMLADALLSDMGFDDETRVEVVKLAKARKFIEINELIGDINIK